jgi:hypothetical protein
VVRNRRFRYVNCQEKGNAPKNMAIIKKTVLNLLNIVKKASLRLSLKRMRKMAGWDNAFLKKVLEAKF